jgi:GNAT superfamily N-acetyltransferase
MADVSFVLADPLGHRSALFGLNVEYLTWLYSEVEAHFGVSVTDLRRMSVVEYVTSTLDYVCGHPPPRGVFYLISVDGRIAGMCGLRPLASDVVEVKRLYIRPAYRGMGLGATAIERLVADARQFGYAQICLDTGPFMAGAQRIYEASGFADCAPYDGSEVPGSFESQWRFMEKRLLPTTG